MQSCFPGLVLTGVENCGECACELTHDIGDKLCLAVAHPAYQGAAANVSIAMARHP